MSMQRLEKFQKNLVEEVCRDLLGEEHLINDVKKTLNLTLDPKKAKEIREATLEHFSKLSKKSMEKADEKYNVSLLLFYKKKLVFFLCPLITDY